MRTTFRPELRPGDIDTAEGAGLFLSEHSSGPGFAMKGWKIVFTGLFATLPALPSVAMEGPASAAEPTVQEAAPDASGEVIEEITVVGQRTILMLRLQMEAAQDDVHRLFNELNTDDTYDIICKTTDRYFSKVKNTQCRPQFAWDALEKDGQMYARQMRGEMQVQGAPADQQTAMQVPVMRDKMMDALGRSPELYDAIVKHAQLMQKLAQAQATYFGEER